MMSNALGAIAAFALMTGMASAQTKIQQGAIRQTSPSDAKEMFQAYCAACHGAEGKGNGPAAAALKKVPADLTKVSARNGGTFPDIKVQRYIKGLDELPAHGSRDMPIWGSLFKSLDRDAAVTDIRVNQLIAYLKTLQQ